MWNIALWDLFPDLKTLCLPTEKWAGGFESQRKGLQVPNQDGQPGCELQAQRERDQFNECPSPSLSLFATISIWRKQTRVIFKIHQSLNNNIKFSLIMLNLWGCCWCLETQISFGNTCFEDQKWPKRGQYVFFQSFYHFLLFCIRTYLNIFNYLLRQITWDEYVVQNSVRPQEADSNVKVQATVHALRVPEHSAHLLWVVLAPSSGLLGQQDGSHACSAWKLVVQLGSGSL